VTGPVRRLGAVLLSAGITLALAAAPAYGRSADDPEPKKLFSIDDDRVTESSGLAKSLKHDGIWWTVNDSGDSARLFGVNADGEVKAVLSFNAEVRDVEAIGVGTDGNIYVADIGDNEARRAKVVVYSMPEPAELTDQKMRYRAYDFAYPDGAHDAEALLVHPRSHRLYIVTKATKSGLYAAPEHASRTKLNTLARVGTVSAKVTDGTFTPDGRRILLRSYFTLTAVNWPAFKAYASVQLPVQPIGESIAMGPTNASVVVGSEGENSAVYQVQIPVGKTTATPTPKPATGQAAGPKEDHTRRWIMIGAGVFGLVVALVTFPVNRRERYDALVERQRDRERQRSRSIT
jgi:hypothetical protein